MEQTLLARKRSPSLTDAELRLMEVVWQKGSATVSDVVEALPARVNLAYSTVLTTLRILEQKGYLKHSKEGRAFVYQSLIGRDQARENAVTHLLRRFFEGSPELLMLNLVEGNKIRPEELQRLRRRIAEEEES
ncbi:MarR family transcriptional regulatory protein [Candidatus Sulfopaludibacter sp. SbA3]|nr:MarR family transcriptional regulatory protein [Candidatus Sulfopaludibacter sp. SbA3]